MMELHRDNRPRLKSMSNYFPVNLVLYQPEVLLNQRCDIVALLML